MRLQIRLFLIMLLAVTIAGGMLGLQHHLDLDHNKRILSNELDQRKKYFGANLISQQQPLLTLSRDYSFWDQMVDFVHTHNLDFAHNNIDTSLETFDVNAAWIYNLQGKNIYGSQADPDNAINAPVLSQQYITDLQKSKSNHYFYHDAGGDLIEIRGATIVPSDDPEHSQPASGYWLVARRIDTAYITQLADLSQSTIKLGSAASPWGDITSDSSVSFARPLLDSSNKTTAVIRAIYPVPIIGELNHAYAQQLFLLSVVGIGLITIVAIMIWWWVLRPIRQITTGIQLQKPELLNKLATTKSEFGNLASLVQLFFSQKLVIEEGDFKREELERLNKEKTTFLSVAAHELKAPSAIIKLISEDLPHTKKTAEGYDPIEINDRLEIITHQANKMSMLVNDLRLAAEGKTDTAIQEDSTFAFDDFLNQEVREIGFVTNQGLTLSGGTNQTITVDREHLSQVVSNLIRNAAKYSPGTDEIIIHSSFGDNQIMVEVQDFGVGISEEDQRHIFERYYRAPSVTNSFQGLGLGLSICKTIIDRMGGRIWVTSEVNMGTHFYFSLPVTQPILPQTLALNDQQDAPSNS